MIEADTQLQNIDASVASRDADTGNPFGLTGMDHVALPTEDIRLMERFLREVLGGEPYAYMGFDDVDRGMGRAEHIFVRVGNTLVQCAVGTGQVMIIKKDDPHISPHWAFRVTAEDLSANTTRLRGLGIPVAGPYSHRGIPVMSSYFMSPEGHKLELCTWEPMEAPLLGSPEVGTLDWQALVHAWPSV